MNLFCWDVSRYDHRAHVETSELWKGAQERPAGYQLCLVERGRNASVLGWDIVLLQDELYRIVDGVVTLCFVLEFSVNGI